MFSYGAGFLLVLAGLGSCHAHSDIGSYQQFLDKHAPSAHATRPSTSPRGLLANVFGSSMVFQSGAPLVLWGFVTPGATVHVSFGSNLTGTGVGDASGLWRASLPALGPSGPYTVNVWVDGSPATNATLTDVHVGTVLLCSGQSNTSGATTPTAFCFNATASEAEAAEFPQLRLFAVGEQAADGWLPPLQQLGFPPHIPWSLANASAARFSGMCYMAAKVLARQLGPGHPLGVIEVRRLRPHFCVFGRQHIITPAPRAPRLSPSTSSPPPAGCVVRHVHPGLAARGGAGLLRRQPAALPGRARQQHAVQPAGGALYRGRRGGLHGGGLSVGAGRVQRDLLSGGLLRVRAGRAAGLLAGGL